MDTNPMLTVISFITAWNIAIECTICWSCMPVGWNNGVQRLSMRSQQSLNAPHYMSNYNVWISIIVNCNNCKIIIHNAWTCVIHPGPEQQIGWTYQDTAQKSFLILPRTGHTVFLDNLFVSKGTKMNKDTMFCQDNTTAASIWLCIWWLLVKLNGMVVARATWWNPFHVIATFHQRILVDIRE